MDEEAVAMINRNSFAELMYSPWCRRVRRDVDMQDAAGGMFHHDKDIEQTKRGRDHDAEVARNDRLRMVADKGPPGLGRRAFAVAVVPALGHVLAYGAWRHPQAQLEQQLIGNPFLAPHRVLLRHAANQYL